MTLLALAACSAPAPAIVPPPASSGSPRRGHTGKAPFAAERGKRLAVARTHTSKPLQRMISLTGYEEYAVAFGAVDYLISKTGEPALRDFWPLVAKTGNLTKAFTRAFGMSPDTFYAGIAK